MTDLVANSVLPANRELINLTTSDGENLIGELASPLVGKAIATIITVHPLPTHGGNTDSHLYRKMSWRLPAQAGFNILRFNTRGTCSKLGTSTGSFDSSNNEGKDLLAAIKYVKDNNLGKPYVVGWSFGTDVTLRHAFDQDLSGVILLSPPLRFTTQDELAKWKNVTFPVVALVPEFDDYLKPDEAKLRFSVAPNIQIVPAAGAKHLWVGENSVQVVMNEIVKMIAPSLVPLPITWDGPMEKWNDI
jgi:alpha/beta superfamily hydrolase